MCRYNMLHFQLIFTQKSAMYIRFDKTDLALDDTSTTMTAQHELSFASNVDSTKLVGKVGFAETGP